MTEGAYPIIVRATRVQRAGRAGLLIVFALAIAGVAGLLFLGKTPNAVETGFAAAFTLTSLGLLVTAWQCIVARVVLERDAIASEGLFGRRELRRDQIAGVRVIRNERLRIFPSDPDAKPITFSTNLLKNQTLLDWFDDVRNLDAEEIDAALKEYEQDPRYGATVEERHARLLLMERIASAGMWLSFGVAGWVSIWPEPYVLAVAATAAMPLIAIVLALGSRGLLRFGLAKGTDIKPSLQTMIVVPSIALAFRAIGDVHILDSTQAWEWSLAAGLVVLVLLVTMSGGWGRIAWGSIFLVAVALIIYCYGVLAYADMSLDTARPARFQTRVVSKHSEYGRSGTRYYLTVEPWGPSRKRDYFRVSGSVYQRENAGDLVCPVLGGGRLGLRWYVFEPCQP